MEIYSQCTLLLDFKLLVCAKGDTMKKSTHVLLIVLLLGQLSSIAFSQSAIEDSSIRREVAGRISREYGVNIDWRQATLLELTDTEARLNTVKRIRSTYRVSFDWRKTTLSELMDAEARMGVAKRIGKATKKSVDWKQYSLTQLLEMEARDSDVDLNSMKMQTAESAIRTGPAAETSTGRGLRVYIVAPSISTSMEARSITMKKGWIESNLRQANTILVVVRSMLFNPLSDSYDSVKELQDDAESQLNISGENFHVYIYSIGDDMNVSQEKHFSYKADG
jgi:hypothetical protein